jgi:Outer membrane protein beta-barrel domain
MKRNCNVYAGNSILLIVILVILNGAAMAQVPPDTTTKPKVDTTVKPKVDTTMAMPMDTTKPAPAAAATATTAAATNEKAGKPKHFSIYAGGNSNTMSGSTDKYNTNAGIGYHVGVAWEKGGFVYWQVGLRFNNAVYGFNSKLTSKDTGNLKVQALDIPLTVGINFLSFARIASLRAFISAVPSFTLGVSDNHFGIQKGDVNDFIFYGQGGIGVSITFLYLDIGYNYGTQSLLKNSASSTNPGQVYVSLGFRF